LRHWVIARSDEDDVVAMEYVDDKAGVFDGQRDDSEIHFPVQDCFDRADTVGAHNAETDTSVLLLELREDGGQDVKTGRFIRADGDFAAWRSMQLSHGDHDVVVALEAVLGERLKDASRGGKCDLAAVAVEESRTDFRLESTNLRRDRRLCHHQLFCGAREAAQTAYFQKCSQLLKVHVLFVPWIRIFLHFIRSHANTE